MLDEKSLPYLFQKEFYTIFQNEFLTLSYKMIQFPLGIYNFFFY